MELERVEPDLNRGYCYFPMQGLPAQRTHLVRSAIGLRCTRPKAKLGHRVVRLSPMSNVFRFPGCDWTDEERDALSRLEANTFLIAVTRIRAIRGASFPKGATRNPANLAKLDIGYVAISPRQHRTVRTRHFADVIRFGLDVLASTAE